MRVLIDTNIIIAREDPEPVPVQLAELLRILETGDLQVLIHPVSIEEINHDQDEKRRLTNLSKIRAYPTLKSPPKIASDDDFLRLVGVSSSPNDMADNNILFSIYKDAVDFLITEDSGILRKAEKSQLKDRVMYVAEALQFFSRMIVEEGVTAPPALQHLPVHHLDLSDTFFDSLREDYPNFDNWFRKISREGRECWVYLQPNKKIGAVLIHKIEDEAIDCYPPFSAKPMLKASTMKVAHTGFKIGELFIKLMVNHALSNGLEGIYLTHFSRPNDSLVSLIKEYGFRLWGKKASKEDVFVKELFPDEETLKKGPRSDISKNYYPLFYDGVDTKKFMVPIRPAFHSKLFTDYRERQTTIPEHIGEFIIEGNTIKKAYLCHSRLKSITNGDLLLFYRSQKNMEVTSLGIVENVYSSLRTREEIVIRVGKRSVYSNAEIESIAEKPTMVILFTLHQHLSRPLPLAAMRKLKINVPQSITKISHNKYLQIKKEGGVDERLTIN